MFRVDDTDAASVVRLRKRRWPNRLPQDVLQRRDCKNESCKDTHTHKPSRVGKYEVEYVTTLAMLAHIQPSPAKFSHRVSMQSFEKAFISNQSACTRNSTAAEHSFCWPDVPETKSKQNQPSGFKKTGEHCLRVTICMPEC